MLNISAPAVPVTDGAVVGVPRTSIGSMSLQNDSGLASQPPTTSPMAVLFRSTAEPAGPDSLSLNTGGSSRRQSWLTYESTPSSPGTQPIIPDAELPPVTQVSPLGQSELRAHVLVVVPLQVPPFP
jgi:hypothetical protein